MFIVFEGLDGSGSSTQSVLLKEWLEKQGREVVLTKEPTDREPVGSLIRQILQHKYQSSPEALQLLFCADRSEHLRTVIQPALNEGKIVISDRYFFSTLAYGALKCNMEWLTVLNQFFPNPDLTFLLKLDPEICLERIAGRGNKAELFEKKGILQRVWQNYEKIAAQYPSIQIIDANQPIKNVSENLMKIVKESLL